VRRQYHAVVICGPDQENRIVRRRRAIDGGPWFGERELFGWWSL